MYRTLRRFLTDCSAAVAFETVIIFPVLTWAWIGTFSYFDSYRVYNTSIKATFTVADLLSRQETDQEIADLHGMAGMLSAMIRDHDGVEVRFTQIERLTSGDYNVVWSEGTGTLAKRFTAGLVEIEDRLPDMASGDRVLLVESFIDYEPVFNFGLNDLSFDNFALIRPRHNQVDCSACRPPTPDNPHDDQAV